MGLDISTYRKIKKLDVLFNADHEPVDPITRVELDCDDWFQAYKNPDFPARADDIEDRAVYGFEESDGFRAGSYGGYNSWRDTLAKMAGYALEKYDAGYGERESYCVECWGGDEGPFSELINFSDAEGVIGTAVSAKLAKDFADYQGKADAHSNDRFRKL